MKIFSSLFLLTLIISSLPLPAAAFMFDRRVEPPSELSYYFYPAAISLPGIGSAQGVGGSLTKLDGEDLNVTLGKVQGDFKGEMLLVTGLSLVPEYLSFSYFNSKLEDAGIWRWERGPDSRNDRRYLLKANRIQVKGGELSLTFFDEQLEFYYAGAKVGIDINAVVDPDGNEHTARLSQAIGAVAEYWGAYLDDTDNRRDPRSGYRVQAEHWRITQDEQALGDGYQDDYNLTFFFPLVPQRHILVWHSFFSAAGISRPGTVNPEDYICDESKYPGCQKLADQLRQGREKEVTLGNATALGGTQRLRAYPNQRFYDSNSFFTGWEYRWYLADHWSAFDYILTKGVFNTIQLAAFYELGQVSPTQDSSLWRNMKDSKGVGLRVILSDLVLRIDAATGAEGSQTTMWIGYGF